MKRCENHAPGLDIQYGGPRCPLCWAYEDEMTARAERDKYGRAINDIALLLPADERPEAGDLPGLISAIQRRLA